MEAVAVYRLCRELCMHLTFEWVNKVENMRSDKLSRLEDSNDHKLDSACFTYIHLTLCGIPTPLIGSLA